MATQVAGEPDPQPAGETEIFTVGGLTPATLYHFALRVADEVPNWSPLSNTPGGATAHEAAVDEAQVERACLLGSHPNPCKPPTRIEYTLPRTGRVTLRVFDAAGRQVNTLVNATRSAGRQAVAWRAEDDQGRRVAPGVYLLVLEAGTARQYRRVCLIE
jgi:hypothetical protein